MNSYKRKIGKAKEDLAAAYLINSGYKIKDRNYSSRYGEIDIVAEDKKCLVIIEVKYRINEDYSLPQQAVTRDKQRKIIRTTQEYILRNRLDGREIRFDVIGITKDDKFTHIKNAFLAPFSVV